MRPAHLIPTVAAALALALAVGPTPVLAQSAPQTRLPEPPLPESAPPSAFVVAARTAIAAGRIGEAREAIERAESRLLVRSVRPSLAATPSDQALVRQLAAARAALGAGDRATALDILAGILPDPALDRSAE
jgi:hypothetical protein